MNITTNVFSAVLLNKNTAYNKKDQITKQGFTKYLPNLGNNCNRILINLMRFKNMTK